MFPDRTAESPAELAPMESPVSEEGMVSVIVIVVIGTLPLLQTQTRYFPVQPG